MNEDELQDISSDINGKPTTNNISNGREDDVPQTPETDGEQSASGDMSTPGSDDDTEEMINEVFGNSPIPGKPFSMAGEIAKDEEDRHGGVFDTEDVEDSLRMAQNPDNTNNVENLRGSTDTDSSPPDDKQ